MNCAKRIQESLGQGIGPRGIVRAMALRLDKSELDKLKAKGFAVEGEIDLQQAPRTTEQAGAALGGLEAGEGLKKAVRHKYNAHADTRKGQRFDSKAEARYFDHLETLKAGGAVLFFLRQVPFHIPGGTYRLDFMEFWKDGTIHCRDIKGVALPMFQFKRKAVESMYPVKIETVRWVKKGWVYETR